MKLSRTVGYALQATLQLAQSKQPGPVPCSRLAAAGQMPERFLLQVLRSLVTHGILQSTRGVEGGYTLDRPAEEISLLEVIEAIDGPLQGDVLSAEGITADANDRLQQALRQVAAGTREQLRAITLSSLILPQENAASSATSSHSGEPSAGMSPAASPPPAPAG